LRGGRNRDGSLRTFYVCDRWRGVRDCTVRTSIRAELVESAIAAALASVVLSDADIAQARANVRAAVESESARLRALSSNDTAAMASELTALRARKERAIKLALETDDEDIAARLREIKTRIASVERQIASARSASWLDDVSARRVEADAVARLERVREMVQDRARLRDALSDLVPEGLTFYPVADLDGEGWEIVGSAAPYPRTSTGGRAPPPPRAEPRGKS
jgi:hypothetical protein